MRKNCPFNNDDIWLPFCLIFYLRLRWLLTRQGACPWSCWSRSLARRRIWRQIWCRAALPRGKPPVDFRSPAPMELKTILAFMYFTWCECMALLHHVASHLSTSGLQPLRNQRRFYTYVLYCFTTWHAIGQLPVFCPLGINDDLCTVYSGSDKNIKFNCN